MEKQEILDSEKNKVMEKARKLIAMMSSPNENEVSNASQLLRKLINKYDLDESILYKINNKTELVQEDGLNMDSYMISGWQSILAGAVAKYYDCSAYRSHNSYRHSSKIVIVGFEPDKTIAKEFLAHLLYLIDSEAQHRNMNDNPNFVSGKKFKNDFSIGASMAICTKLKDLKWAQKLSDNLKECMDLIVLKADEIDKYMEAKKLKKTGGVKYEASEEFLNGYEYGSKINLDSRGSLE